MNLYSEEIPRWITNSIREDELNHYIVCSSDSENLDEARKKAELECLGSIFKIKGIPISTRETVTLSLNENDFQGVINSNRVESEVGCNYTDQFIEKINLLYRVWLRCRITKEVLLSMNIKISKVQKKSESMDLDERVPQLKIGESLESLKEYIYLNNLEIKLKEDLCLKYYEVLASVRIKDVVFCFSNLNELLIGKCSYHNLKCL